MSVYQPLEENSTDRPDPHTIKSMTAAASVSLPQRLTALYEWWPVYDAAGKVKYYVRSQERGEPYLEIRFE